MLLRRQRGDVRAADRTHSRRYHALPLEHANRNLIFNYKIASVCGILIGNRKPQAVRIMTMSVRHISSELRMPGAPRAADDDRKRRSESGGPGTAVITKTKTQIKKPSLYRVLLLNDDYTPMEFVVHVLERFFNKDREAATRIMLHVHHHGIGECGIFTYEVAETKVTQVMDFARKHQHPLQCVMEKK
jgi:ATP-dependent Clp protease adaptor protein ClpS